MRPVVLGTALSQFACRLRPRWLYNDLSHGVAQEFLDLSTYPSITRLYGFRRRLRMGTIRVGRFMAFSLVVRPQARSLGQIVGIRYKVRGMILFPSELFGLEAVG